MPPEPIVKGLYVGCIVFAMLTMLWGAPRGCGVHREASAKAQKDPSVRAGSSRRTRYVFIGGFGGK